MSTCINRNHPDYAYAVKETSVDYVETYWLSEGKNLDGIREHIDIKKKRFSEEQVTNASRIERIIARRKSVVNDLYKQSRTILAKYNEEKAKKKPSKKKMDWHIVQYEQLHFKMDKEVAEINKLRTDQSVENLSNFYTKDLKFIEEVLSNSNATAQDVLEALQITKVWEDLGDPESGIIFTKEEIEHLDDTQNKWRSTLSGHAYDMNFKYNRLITKYDEGFYKDIIRKEFKETLTEELESTIGSVKDVGRKSTHWLKTRVLNISESSEVSFQALQQMYKRAITEADMEIDDLIRQIEDQLGDLSKEDQQLFRQTASNTDTRQTGNITSIFTANYHKESYKARSLFKYLSEGILENPELSATEKSNEVKQVIHKYRRKSKAIEEIFDPNILFRDIKDKRSDEQLEKDRAEYKEKMIKLLGNEDVYNRYFNMMEEKVERYKLSYKTRLAAIEAESRDVIEEMEAFKNNYSPFYQAKVMTKFPGAMDQINPYTFNFNTLIRIAKKVDSDGRALEHYDNKFSKIQNDSRLKEAYWFQIELMQRLYSIPPKYMIDGFNMHTIPHIEKTFFELYVTEGTGQAVSSIWDKVSLLGATNQNENVPDPSKQEAQLNGIHANKSNINRDMNIFIENYIRNNKKPTNAEALYDWNTAFEEAKEEEYLNIQNKYAIANNSDLSKIMKGYAAAMVMYKHKAAINDSVKGLYTIVRDQLKNRQKDLQSEAIEAKGWNKFIGKKTRIVKEAKNIDNMINQIEHTMATLYGYNTKKKRTSSSLKRTVVKASDKATYNEFEKLIRELQDDLSTGKINIGEYEKRVDKLIDNKNSLEFELNANTLLDSVNTYIRLKGIGWNVFSGVSNVGFGIVANWLRAADGRIYNNKDLAFGYKLTMQSTVKSLTNVQMKGAKKLRAIIDVYDFFKKSKHEIIEKKSSIGNKFETFGPWNLMERGEYVNQAPVVAAMLKHQKIEYNGEMTTLWDLLQEDGTFPEDVSEEIKDLMVATKISFDRTISRDHGNYDTDLPMLWDKEVGGRLTKTFRTWMPQALYGRIGEERPSFSTGTIEKGRWRSWVDLYSHSNDESNFGQRALFISRQIIRKLYTNTEFDYYVNSADKSKTISPKDFNSLVAEEKMNWERRFTEVDAANMRANILELYMMTTNVIMVTLLGMAISNMFDDDDEYTKKSTLFALNILGRIQTDLFMWVNPIEFDRVLKNVIPMSSIIIDGQKLINHVWNMGVYGDPDKVPTGPYAGISRLWRYGSEFVPGLSAINTVQSLGISSVKN